MNGSGIRRLLVITLTVLLSFILVTSALAAKPEMFTIPVDDTLVLGSCDGFDVIEQVQGKIKVSTHFDQDGNFVMEIARFSLRHTYTNSETGASLRSPDVGIDKIRVHEDGSGTVAVVGIVAHIVVPGEGPVFTHLGRIVFDINTGQVLFEAGRHDDFAGLLPALCSALD
ncbi:MAG TPA: hypothetical protein VK900_08630 [Anaerolineales bacterium]|nr:hypothetical protein [Anaerolineales bacterium]